MIVVSLLGFVVGFLGLCFLLLVSLYRRHIRPLLIRKLPPKNRPPPIPSDILSLILSSDTPLLRRHSPEPARWLNQLLATLFHHTRRTPAVRSSLLFDKLSEVVVDVRRRGLGRWVRESRLVEAEPGNALPRVERVRLVGEGDARLPVTLAFDLEYEGGLAGTAYFDTIFGVRVWLTARLQRLDGTMYVMFQEKAFHMTFPTLRELHLDARVTVGGIEWGGLNWLMGEHLLPWTLKRRFLMPNMRSKWWLDRPPKPYYPWDPEVQAEPELLYQER